MKKIRFLILTLLILLPATIAYASAGDSTNITGVEIVSGYYATPGFYSNHTDRAGVVLTNSDGLSNFTTFTENEAGSKFSNKVSFSQNSSYNFSDVANYTTEYVSSVFYKTGILGFHYLDVRYYPDGF